jgi:hypothetical protein
VVPSRCNEAFSREITSEKVKQHAKQRSQTETFALLPSLLQGSHLDLQSVVTFPDA